MKKKEKQMMEEEKNELAMRLLLVKDKNVVQALKVLFDELIGPVKKTKRISKTQYNKEIDRSMEQIKSGKYISHEEMIMELEELQKLHRSGKSKSYTVAEVRDYAYSKLKK